MKALRKVTALLLLLSLVSGLAGCGSSLSIEGGPWTMEVLQDSQTGEVLAGQEKARSLPGGILDLSLTAEEGIFRMEDRTNDKTYEGTYIRAKVSPDSVIYDISVEGQAGQAVVSVTRERGRNTETLVLSTEGWSLRFTR